MGSSKMVSNNQDLAALLRAAYKGIEGFYILNRNGGLGYFSTDGQRLLRETFEDVLSTPELREMIEAFFSELRNASTNFPPGEDKELGYLSFANPRSNIRDKAFTGSAGDHRRGQFLF